jgi:photosystem II stability/assembly factor-like uncharacterized protein
MRLNIAFILLTFIICTAARSQDWQATAIPASARYDDVFFINDSVGWAVCGEGKIYHTTNGGNTWIVQFTTTKYLRSIKFVTPEIGYCGSLDTHLYRTTDGGQSWVDISAAITPKPAGICGLSVPDAQHVYGCGIWRSPAFIIKSSDGGVTWTYQDMSAYAKALVDIYFLNKDTGFAAGTANPSSRGGIVLYTTNGGATWEVKFETMTAEDIIWKIQSPDNNYFFGSVYGSPVTNARIVRSTNRGITWSTIQVKPSYHSFEMVGFLDRSTGWVGGRQTIFKTTDGGLTWSDNLMTGDRAFNRFFRLSNNLAYLSGNLIYKYKKDTPDPVDPGGLRNDHSIVVHPNPVNGRGRIQLQFVYNTFADVSLYTGDGKKIAILLHEHVSAGKRTISLNLNRYAAGVYYLVLNTNEGVMHTRLVKR